MGKKGQKKQKVTTSGANSREDPARVKQSQPCASDQRAQTVIFDEEASSHAQSGTMQVGSSAVHGTAKIATFEQASTTSKTISIPTPPISPTPKASKLTSTPRLASTHTNSPTASRTESLPSTSTRADIKIESKDMVDYQYGGSPLVIACVSCNTVCLITNRLSYNNARLGLRPVNNDRFLPIVCDECQEWNAHSWLQIANAVDAPHRSQQYPSTISTRLLAGWFVYSHFKNRFGVEFDETEEPNKRVTRARDWWREGVLTDNTAIERITYFKLKKRAVRKEGDDVPMMEEAWVDDDDHKKVTFFGSPATGTSI